MLDNVVLADFVDRLRQSPSERYGDIIGDFIGECGFSTFTFAGIAGFPGAEENGVPPHVTTVGPAWKEHYIAHAFQTVDPVLPMSFSRITPFCYPDIDRRALTPPQRRVFEHAEDFHKHIGLAAPVHGPWGSVSFLSIYHDGDERAFRKALRTLPLLHMAASHIHEAFLADRQAQQPPPQRIVFTPRETECVTWAAQGKTAWEISRILRVSERTVKFHMQNAMRKLGVHTRSHAVARAVALGLVRP